MKKTSLRVALLLLLFCLLAAGSAQAAGKKGLVKEGKKYYYYQKNRKVKNTWKSVKVKKTTYKLYFGRDGAAYTGKKDKPAIKKIKGNYYAFDEKSHMIKGVVFIEKKFDYTLYKTVGTFYVFGGNGKLNNAETKQLRNLYNKVIHDKQVRFKDFQTLLNKYGEKKPQFMFYLESGCNPDWEEGHFYQYAHVVFTLHKDLTNGQMYIDGFNKYLSKTAIMNMVAE